MHQQPAGAIIQLDFGDDYCFSHAILRALCLRLPLGLASFFELWRQLVLASISTLWFEACFAKFVLNSVVIWLALLMHCHEERPRSSSVSTEGASGAHVDWLGVERRVPKAPLAQVILRTFETADRGGGIRPVDPAGRHLLRRLVGGGPCFSRCCIQSSSRI